MAKGGGKDFPEFLLLNGVGVRWTSLPLKIHILRGNADNDDALKPGPSFALSDELTRNVGFR